MSTTAAPLPSSSLPLIVSPPKEEKQLYVLTYRQRQNPHPLTKNFYGTGTIRDMIQRGKDHCDRMNLVFHRIEPFIADLEAEERRNSLL